MKNRKKGPPEDKTPKFEFYLYNDAGRIIKQYLSIHEIQQILLQQSQNLGLQQLAWLIGRNETNWRPTEQPRRTLPTTPTTPKTPLTMATNSIGNNSQVLGVLGKIQGIVASAQEEDEVKIKDKTKTKNKQKKRKKKPNRRSTTKRPKKQPSKTSAFTTPSTTSSSTTTSTTTTSTTTKTTTTKTTSTTTSTTTPTGLELFELNLFADIKPWTYTDTDQVTETASDVADTLDISDEDPFSNMFDLSMLRPQSPFISDRNKVEMSESTERPGIPYLPISIESTTRPTRRTTLQTTSTTR